MFKKNVIKFTPNKSYHVVTMCDEFSSMKVKCTGINGNSVNFNIIGGQDTVKGIIGLEEHCSCDIETAEFIFNNTRFTVAAGNLV